MQNQIAAVIKEVSKVIIGQDPVLERILVALLSKGHVLLEGVPGLAKTKALLAVARALSADMRRVQFTPDLLPSDIIGTEIYRPQTAQFELRKGPIFTNILFADEINRAPAKVQSALLQAMQEQHVSIGNETLALPQPFFVLATQNPIEQEGTYPLPEAQQDRFLMKLTVDYPSFEKEVEIIRLSQQENDLDSISPCLGLSDLNRLSAQAREVFVDEKIDRYIVSLVQATRDPKKYGLGEMLEWGASPRASIALRGCGQSLAFIRGKDYVAPDEIKELAADVLRHRIILSYEAEAQRVSADDVIATLLKSVPHP